MGLETATYINQLNAAWPTGSADAVAQGDDHLRLIKSTLQASFPNITGAVTLTHAQINDAAQKTAANVFTAVQTINAVQAGAGLQKLRGSTTPDPNAFLSYFDSADTRRGWIGYGAADNSLRINNEISAGKIQLLTAGGGAIELNGVAASDYARLSQANTFAGEQVVSASFPRIALDESDQASGNRRWRIAVDAQLLAMQACADNEATATSFLEATRAGNVVLGGGSGTVTVGNSAEPFSSAGLLRIADDAAAWLSTRDVTGDVEGFFGSDGGAAFSGSRSNHDYNLYTNNTLRQTISAAGNFTFTAAASINLQTPLLQAQGIHNGTAPTGTNHYIASGTYTPTITGVSNVDGSSAPAGAWIRVGRMVIVEFTATIDATTNAVSTVFGVSLPIASNLAAASELNGGGAAASTGITPLAISGDATNDRCNVQFISSSVNNHVCTGLFMYPVN